MANDNNEMAEFAGNLWNNYIRPKVEQMFTKSVTFYKAVVTENAGSGTAKVQRPYDNPITVSCAENMKNVAVGTKVLVLRFGSGNGKNHLIVATASGDPCFPTVPTYKEVKKGSLVFATSTPGYYILDIGSGKTLIAAYLRRGTSTGASYAYSTGCETMSVSHQMLIHFNSNSVTGGTMDYFYVED